VELDGTFLRANSRFCELTGYAADELPGRTFQSVTHPDDCGLDTDQFDALVAGTSDTYQTEKRFIRKDGSVVWVALSASMVRDEGGAPLYGIRIVQEITELKRAEARQKFLLDELNHRVKNMLATVQSVAMQTRRNAADLDAFTHAFEGRLMALNRAHELLTREIGKGVLLRDLLLATVAPFEDEPGQRFQLSGPELRLGSEIAVTLAMALHELTTNAAKYGALATPQGRISVEWQVPQSGPMTIGWTETGGLPVTKPARRGFGSDLIERALARQFGGTAVLEFNEEGIRCLITAPVPKPPEPIT
jgi:PAS domain S-box-containing protein